MADHDTIDHAGLTGVGSSTFVGVRVKRASADFALGNNTLTAIQFNAEDFDTSAFHDNSTNTTRLTVPTDLGGKYLIGGSFYTGVAKADLIIRVNGTTNILFDRRQAADALTSVQGITVYALVATDYVELVGRTPAGSGSATYDAGVSPIFWMYRIGA